MPDYIVRIEDLAGIIKKHEEERKQSLSKAIVDAATVGTAAILNSTPKSTGQLQQTLHVETGTDPKAVATIVADAPYAAAVERGSRPHRPPYGPILQWVRTKFGLDGEDAHRAAAGVVNKIETVGIAPTLFVKSKIPILRDFLKQAVTRYLKK